MIIKNIWSVVNKGSKGSVVSKVIRALKPLTQLSKCFHR